MPGCTLIRKRCVCCQQFKSTAGCKLVNVGRKDRLFVYAACVTDDQHKKLEEKYGQGKTEVVSQI